jgi:hypothetical protein
MTQSTEPTKSKRKHGGNRPGAGRPLTSKFGRKANFSTRLSQSTRDLLGAEARIEARRTGRAVSVSRTAERLLRSALEKKSADSLRSEELRDLFFLIESLTMYVQAHHHKNDPQYSWYSNPYLFEAFRRAIAHLMTVMRPEGEIVPPPPAPKPEGQNHNDTDNPFLGFADFVDELTGFKYPDSVDDYARTIARQLIERARTEVFFEDSRGTSKRVVTLDGEEVEIVPDEDDDYTARKNRGLSRAARKLFRRGK